MFTRFNLTKICIPYGSTKTCTPYSSLITLRTNDYYQSCAIVLKYLVNIRGKLPLFRIN